MWGRGRMETLEPRRGGKAYPESSTGYLVGSRVFGGLPRLRGSAMTAFREVAAAVSGLHRYTLSSGVPLRPGKFRLKVRTDAPCVEGANPIPMHGPHATSSSLTPARMSFVMTPPRRHAIRTWREPGETA